VFIRQGKRWWRWWNVKCIRWMIRDGGDGWGAEGKSGWKGPLHIFLLLILGQIFLPKATLLSQGVLQTVCPKLTVVKSDAERSRGVSTELLLAIPLFMLSGVFF